jgi:hypothetical protein
MMMSLLLRGAWLTEGVDTQEAAYVVGFPVQAPVNADGAQGARFPHGVDAHGLWAPVQVVGSGGCLYCGAGDEFQGWELWGIGFSFHNFAFAFVEHETN